MQDEHLRRRSVIAVVFRRQMTQRFKSATGWGLGPRRCWPNKSSTAVSEQEDDVRRRNDLRWSFEFSPVVADAMFAAPRLLPTIGVLREFYSVGEMRRRTDLTNPRRCHLYESQRYSPSLTISLLVKAQLHYLFIISHGM